MTARNTPALPQRNCHYGVQLTAANTNYTSPTNTGLLWVAGPDGSDLHGLAAVPYATGASINQLQFFSSPDGGTTFNQLPLGAAVPIFTQAQNAATPVTNVPHPNGVPMGPTNAFKLTGAGPHFDLALMQSLLTESTLYFKGGRSQGMANAQTLPYCYNAYGTQLPASPTAGTIVDFEAGPTLTNTTTMTIAPGAQSAAAIKRTSGTQLSAGDITAGFPYRMIWDGTEWILLITQRVYVAQGQAQSVVVSAWGMDY